MSPETGLSPLLFDAAFLFDVGGQFLNALRTIVSHTRFRVKIRPQPGGFSAEAVVCPRHSLCQYHKHRHPSVGQRDYPRPYSQLRRHRFYPLDARQSRTECGWNSTKARSLFAMRLAGYHTSSGTTASRRIAPRPIAIHTLREWAGDWSDGDDQATLSDGFTHTVEDAARNNLDITLTPTLQTEPRDCQL